MHEGDIDSGSSCTDEATRLTTRLLIKQSILTMQRSGVLSSYKITYQDNLTDNMGSIINVMFDPSLTHNR